MLERFIHFRLAIMDFIKGGETVKIINKQTGLIWEVIDKTLQKRLLAQEHYEQVKLNTKKTATTKKKE